jgi:hypothetical protein
MITDRYIPDPAEFSGNIYSSDFETDTRKFHTLSDIADRIRSDESFNRSLEKQTSVIRNHKNKES